MIKDRRNSKYLLIKIFFIILEIISFMLSDISSVFLFNLLDGDQILYLSGDY